MLVIAAFQMLAWMSLFYSSRSTKVWEPLRLYELSSPINLNSRLSIYCKPYRDDKAVLHRRDRAAR